MQDKLGTQPYSLECRRSVWIEGTRAHSSSYSCASFIDEPIVRPRFALNVVVMSTGVSRRRSYNICLMADYARPIKLACWTPEVPISFDKLRYKIAPVKVQMGLHIIALLPMIMLRIAVTQPQIISNLQLEERACAENKMQVMSRLRFLAPNRSEFEFLAELQRPLIAMNNFIEKYPRVPQ